jgi:hypothetical protein
MAHNFKILDGTMYISKSGHDSNDGTIDSPKRSFNDASFPHSADVIVGAGHYIGGNITNTNQPYRLRGDGKVILDSISWSNKNYFYGTNDDINIEYRNMSVICRQGSIADFIIRDGILKPYVSSSMIKRAIVINSVFEMASDDYMNILDSIIINSTGITPAIVNSYVDKSTVLTFDGPKDNFFNNNMRGVISLLMTDSSYKNFTVQDQLTGTPQDNGYAPDVYWLNEDNLTTLGYSGTIVGWDAKVATCMNREPLFNNESLEDFSLQAGSPHIGAGDVGQNIGGTKLAYSITNADVNNTNLEIIPSPEIDTTNTNSYTLKEGFEEGYIDYIQKIGSSPLTLGVINPISTLNFNSDYEGGTLENNNVPDSEPSTSSYPRTLTTTSNAMDAQTLEISGHDVQIGEFVRVNGEDREVISITTNNVRVDSIFRGNIISGSKVQVGSKNSLSALKPNRLTYLLRTSKKETKPTLLSDWDNDADPLYDMGGKFLTQEWDTVPGYVIDNNTNTLYGAGDSDAPRNLPLNEISCRWVNLRVYLRNNYSS